MRFLPQSRSVIAVRVLTLAALSLALTGCHKKVKAAPVALPPPFVGEGAPPIAVPPPTHVTPDAKLVEPEVPVVEEPKPKPKPPRKATKQTTPPPAVTTPPPTQPNPSITALGTLSAGGDVSAETRDAAAGLLRSVHQRMDSTPLDRQAAHHDQFERVKNFVRQADDAWKGGDVEGTRNLATKARVLLDEIQR